VVAALFLKDRNLESTEVQNMETSSACGLFLGCSTGVWFPGEENACTICIFMHMHDYLGCAVNDHTVMMDECF
jgi:hypothetical protein